MKNQTTLVLIVAIAAVQLTGLGTSSAQDPAFFPPQKPKPAAAEIEKTLEKPAPSDSRAETIGQDAIFFPPVKRSDQPAVNQPPLKPADAQPAAAAAKAAPDAKPAAPIVTDLPRTVKKQIDEAVIPALKDERHFDFLQAMGKLIGRLDTEALASVEKYVQAHGFSVRDHFISLLARAIEQQEKIPVPELKIDVIEYINSGLRKHVDSELAELNQHLVMQEQPELPGSWRDCEQLFWEVHVWKNRMTNVGRMTEYGVAIQKRLLDRANKRQDTPTVNRLQPTVMLHYKVQQHYRMMIEGEAVLRIAELKKAENALRSSKDFEERISAAFALELHADQIGELFEHYPAGSFIRPMLNEQQLRDNCDQLIAKGREAGKDVIEKAILLRQGAHWWLRGRYGEGPLANGLLKSKEAMQSPHAMFGLYMPKERPRPIGKLTSDNSIAPGVDRRHYYTWAVEKRNLRSSTKHLAPENAPIPRSYTSTFW